MFHAPVRSLLVSALALVAGACQGAQEVDGVIAPFTPPGEVVVDSLDIAVSPDSIRWFVMLHFVHRPAIFESFTVRADARNASVALYDVPLPPPPLGIRYTFQGKGLSGSMKEAGDSAIVELFMEGRFYEPSSTEFDAFTEIAWRTAFTVVVDSTIAHEQDF
jgi:hypothetical protein